MGEKASKIYFLVLIIMTLGVIILGYIVEKQRNIINDFNNKQIDTSYNKVVLDSIEYNIVKKDSLLIIYKTKFEYEIKEITYDTDSAAVERFYDLVSR